MSNKRRLPSAVPVIIKHLERVMRYDWGKILTDPRSEKNKTWNFDYIVSVLFYGIIGGCKEFRDVEVFSEGYDERIPDTSREYRVCTIARIIVCEKA